jgi:hypothetical protein
MLYKGQSIKEIQTIFDNQINRERQLLKENVRYYDYSRWDKIRFKKGKVDINTKLKHCINRFVGKSIDDVWSYFIRHSKVNASDLTYWYRYTFYSDKYGRSNEYDEQFKDGIVQYACKPYDRRSEYNIKIEKSVTYKGITYKFGRYASNDNILVSTVQTNEYKKEEWLVFGSFGCCVEFRTWLIFDIPSFVPETIDLDALIEKEKEYLKKVWVNYPNYNKKYPIDTNKLIKVFNQKQKFNEDLYYDKANETLQEELFKTTEYNWHIRQSIPRKYTLYSNTFEQLTTTETEVEIPVEEVIEVVKNIKPKRKPKGYYMNKKCYRFTKQYGYVGNPVKVEFIPSYYKSNIEPVVEEQMFTKEWVDTRKKDMLALQSKEQKENLLIMERLGFDETSFTTPTHIYRELRNKINS